MLEAQTNDLSVLLGYNGVISRSIDSGLNWEVVFEEGHLSFLIPGGNHPDHIWAGGGTTFVYENGPGQMQVNDMSVAEINGEEVVFLGTNQGVYSFRLKK